METFNVQDARRHIGELLDRVEEGEEIVISRRGMPIARLVPMGSQKAGFPDHRALRASLPPARAPAATTVRQIRDDERY